VGIVVEYESYKKSSADVSETELLFDINYEVARFYSDNLLSRPEGEVARRYLTKENKTNFPAAFDLDLHHSGMEQSGLFRKRN
jgi:DNA primase